MSKNILPFLILTLVVAPLMLGTTKVSAATFTVTNTSTSGAGSLVQAINDANANAGQDTISFSATGNINMANVSLPALTDSVIFNGPGVANLTISNTTIYTNTASNLASLSFSNLNLVNTSVTSSNVNSFSFTNNSISCGIGNSCVTLDTTSNSTVSGNTIVGTIYHQSGSSNTFTNNTATSIYISSGDNHQISNNNLGDIYLSTTTNTTVTNNTLTAGLYISSGSKQNTITQNTIPGQVYVDGVGSNNISNNTLNDRIYVSTNSNNNLISQNTYNTTQANPITLSGGNISIPAPTLITATSSVGGPNSTIITVTGTAVAGSKIEFYSKIGNVYTFLFSAVEGSATDNNNASGSFSFNVNTPNSNNLAFFILATNTDTLNNTSQFSNQISFTPPVVPATPTISLTSSKNPSLVGESINLRATLSDPLLTGNIEFFNGNTSLGSVAVTAGQAILTTSSLPQGSNAIRAIYTLANATTIQANLTQVVNTVVVVNGPAGNPVGGITIYPNSPVTKPNSNVTTLPVTSAVTATNTTTSTNNVVLSASEPVVTKTEVSQPKFDDTGSTALIRTGGENNQILKLTLMVSGFILLGYLVVKSNQVQNESKN